MSPRRVDIVFDLAPDMTFRLANGTTVRPRTASGKTPLADANSDRQTAFEDEGLPSC
jgi:hypothetical protein